MLTVSLAILTIFVLFKEAPSQCNENLSLRGVEELDFFGLRRSQLLWSGFACWLDRYDCLGG